MLSSNRHCPPVETPSVRGMVVDDDGATKKASRGGDWNGEYYYDEYCHRDDDGRGGGMTTIVDATMKSRCDLYLGLSLAYLIAMISISSSSSSSEYSPSNEDEHSLSSPTKAAVLTLSSLSFVTTMTLGACCAMSRGTHCPRRPERASPILLSPSSSSSSSSSSSCRQSDESSAVRRLLQVASDFFATHERLAVSFVFVTTCISSGMILYPYYYYDDETTTAHYNVMAVMGNEVWNPNLFYSAYLDLYGSAYLAIRVLVFYNYGDYDTMTKTSMDDDAVAPCCKISSSTAIATYRYYHSSRNVATLSCMAVFTSVCAATALLIAYHGPACHGVYLEQTTYCASANVGGWLSVWSALFSATFPIVDMALLRRRHALSHRRRSRSGHQAGDARASFIRHAIIPLVVASTISLILQCVDVAIVNTSGGPGHEVGNSFVTSWAAWIVSLLFWRESCLELFTRRCHYHTSFAPPPSSMVMSPTKTCDTSMTRRIRDERTKRREEQRPSSSSSSSPSSRRFDDSARSGSGASTDAMTDDDTFDCCRDHCDVVNNTRLSVGASGNATTTANDVTFDHKMIGNVEYVARVRDTSGVSTDGRRIVHLLSRTKRENAPGGEGGRNDAIDPDPDEWGSLVRDDNSRPARRARDDDARRARDDGSHRNTAKGHRRGRPRHGAGNCPDIRRASARVSGSDPEEGVFVHDDSRPERRARDDDAKARDAKAKGHRHGRPRYDARSDPHGVHHGWNLYHDARREIDPRPAIDNTSQPFSAECGETVARKWNLSPPLPTMTIVSTTTTTTTTGTKPSRPQPSRRQSFQSNLSPLHETSLDDSSSVDGTMRSGVKSTTKVGSEECTSLMSDSCGSRTSKDLRREKRHDGSGDTPPSDNVSENSNWTRSRKVPPPPPRPRNDPNQASKIKRGGTNDRILLCEVPIRNTHATSSTSRGNSSFVTEANPLASDGKKPSHGSSDTPATMYLHGSGYIASKRDAAAVAAAMKAAAATGSHQLIPQETVTTTKLDLSESDFVILLSGDDSVITEITLDEYATLPFAGQALDMSKSDGVTSAFHATDASANTKEVVDFNSTMEEIADRFRYKMSSGVNNSSLRQKRSQSPSPHHLEYHDLPSVSSYNEYAIAGNASRASRAKEVDRQSNEEVLASSMREALIALNDKNPAHIRRPRRSTLESRAKVGQDANPRDAMRSTAPIRQRGRSDENISDRSLAPNNRRVSLSSHYEDATYASTPGRNYEC